ncbi:MAG TPA: protein kinase [Candidatus Eisenbacteria bacterium]|nr:protein kinase [Candidatus Eisenbacteria bacterium]
MRLAVGTRLGPYEVVSPLGAGGMGEVYRARDTRLGRDVAIKVLPQHLIENAEVRARFEREARTISSLNHPNICTLFDVGREGDVEFLVMELIDGETLAQRLLRGPLPVAELLRLGIQIADALDRAHRAGIVHRDFKPGNVMITRSGAKLMDFGLARALAPQGAPAGGALSMAQLTQSPTAVSPLTSQGALVGTFLYMSPEQLEGRDTDARSDLWALGCVLYEMATGRHAFEGKSQASLIGAIMNTEPAPIAALAPLAPPALDGLVRACLAKDPEERVQTAHDVKLQLTWMASGSSQVSQSMPAVRHRLRREPLAWAVATVAILAAGALAWRDATRPPRAQLRFTIPVPAGVTSIDLPRISPDGRMLAFAAKDSTGRTMIWLRPLNALTTNPLPGTENSLRPFWSPDSRYIGFVADGKLKKIPVAGGPAEVVCDAASGADGSWSPKDVILFDGDQNDPVRRVNANGGEATPAVRGDSTAGVGWPVFLPDGNHFLFTRLGNDGAQQMMVGALGTGRTKALGIVGSRAEIAPDGYVLFARDRTLLGQRFDMRAMSVHGDPFPVAEDLPVAPNGQANFSVSRNGVLVYRATGATTNQLAWLDRSGHEVAQVASAADYRAPALSPDGSRIAIRRTDTGNIDVWIIEPARGTTTRFTFDPGSDSNPIWSPDGSQVAWGSDRGKTSGIYVKSSSGLGAEQTLVTGPNPFEPLDWSRDGKWLLYQSGDPKTRADIFALSMTGAHTAQPVLQTPFSEQRAKFSPNGRWIAYESDESGRNEVYVATFQGPAGKWQISTRGGSDPCWSHDGRELFFLSADQHLMAMPVGAGDSFNPGTPHALFQIATEQSGRRNVYDVSPDGSRFLFLLPANETSTPITVVVNWQAGVGRR